MRPPLSRSLVLVAGLLLLGGCDTLSAWWGGAPDAQRQREARTAKPGLQLANLLPQDDETAVDEREIARQGSKEARRRIIPRTGSGGTPPKLNVLYVANGRIRAYGSHVIVRGTVDDDGEIATVTINGRPAQVKDRAFSRRLPAPLGESEVVVRAEDDDGNAAETRFTIVRAAAGQRLPPQRPVQVELASPEYRYMETASGIPGPRLEDLDEPGVYMILLAGTPSAHFVRMPGLAQCREAVEYTENAVCTFHRGRN